jgi:hypothetical protein
VTRINLKAASGTFKIDDRFVVRDGDGRIVESWWCVDRWSHDKARDCFAFNVDGYRAANAL